jgi:FkbM family methyltransferase
MPELETRYGRLTVPDADTDVIGRFLARYGEWAWCEASFVASVLKDGARVLDVGAFAGTFGLGLALSRHLGFLCFVEANPVVSRLLEGNVAGKTACPIKVVEAMVAGPQARPRLGRCEPGNLGSMSFSLDGDGADVGPAPALAVTLADLRTAHGPFELIKLDVEGMELEVLQADADHLASGRTMLWIECNEEPGSLDVARLLLSWNLDLYYFAFPSYNPDNFNGDPEAVFPLAFEAGILAAPMTRPTLTMDLQVQGCILRPVRSVGDLKDAMWRTPRWGMPEWEGATSRQELAALAGRSLRGESFETFLQGPGPASTIWQRLETTEAALRIAETLAIERLQEATAERERREAAEAGLRTAETLAIERLHDVAAERERREAAEAGLRTAERLAFQHLDDAVRERERRERVEADLRVAAAALTEARDGAAMAAAELARTSARGLSHLSALGEARERVAVLEQAVRDQQSALDAGRQTLQAQAELTRAQADQVAKALDELAGAHAVIRSLEQRAQAAEHAIEVIRASTAWRIMAPARGVVGAWPGLRSVLRRGRGAVGAVLHRWRR